MGTEALWDSVAADALTQASSWLSGFQGIIGMFVAIIVVGLIMMVIVNARR